jgi:hypothetical protein
MELDTLGDAIFAFIFCLGVYGFIFSLYCLSKIDKLQRTIERLEDKIRKL